MRDPSKKEDNDDGDDDDDDKGFSFCTGWFADRAAMWPPATVEWEQKGKEFLCPTTRQQKVQLYFCEPQVSSGNNDGDWQVTHLFILLLGSATETGNCNWNDDWNQN